MLQIITITFPERITVERDKAESLPANNEFVTLWCWLVYSWTTQNSKLVNVCGKPRQHNKYTIQTQIWMTLWFKSLLFFIVLKKFITDYNNEADDLFLDGNTSDVSILL